MSVETPAWGIVDAILSGLAGGIAVYLIWFLQRRHERKDRVRKMATAILVQLRVLDHILRLVANDRNAASSLGEMPIELFDHLGKDLLDFDARTLFLLYDFVGMARQTQIIREQHRNIDPAMVNGASHMRARQSAGFALCKLSPLYIALLTAGGTDAPRIPIEVAQGRQMPMIPPSPWDTETSKQVSLGDPADWESPSKPRARINLGKRRSSLVRLWARIVGRLRQA